MTPRIVSSLATISVALVVATGTVGGQAQPPPPLAEANPAIEELVRSVLARFPDRRHIPGIRLFPATESVPLAVEARTFKWTERVLPTDGGRPFRLTDRAALQRAADAQRRNQYYVFVHDDALTPDLATLWVGAAFARPSDITGPVECCCSWRVQLKHDGTRWALVESDESVSRCY